ncbi:hypothetical protein V1523DRAFT_410452 [Lipomyces doorenjongii]
MPEATRLNRGFHIGHQKVTLDVDFATRTIIGSSEITVLPTDPTLRSIHLDFRQAKVTGAFVSGKAALWDYEDFWSTTSSSPFKESARTIYQYNQFEDKLAPVIHENLSGELVVHFPRGVKVQPQDPFTTALSFGTSPSLSRHESPEIAAATPSLARTDLYNAFVPITVRVEFRLTEPTMGLTFIEKNSEHRYEHAYTFSNPYGISASSWLPCVDGLWERCSWEFEITVPKTIGDIKGAQADGVVHDKDEEDSERDIVVVCIGDLQQEATNEFDHSKKTVTFVLTSPVAAQHVGFAVGPFVQTNLSELKESDEDEGHHSSSAMEVYAYALPGRQDEVVNTCMFMHKAMEFFVREYSSYPFGSFSLCFVENALDDMEPCSGLAIVSDRHLFPGDIIDQIYPVTKYLTTLLASQWSSVNIVPKNWNSLWVTIGICRYITGMFLRRLMGNNEHRFRLKKDAERICDLDIGRPPIGHPDLEFPIDKSTLDFVGLKAPVILHILDRRLTKSGGSFGLTRVIPKIFWQAMSGDLTNGCLSTSHFQRLCEKVSHAKLDSFFQEWVFGSGYPIFRITQRFNKKKMFIEMGIRQVQNVEMPKTGELREESFVKDAKKYLHGESLESTVRPIFTGPMTIRIHEADGTPYEHVVNIKDSFTKLDIQYNTKYKRLKRHLRNRDKPSANVVVASATSSGEPIDDGELDGVLLHSLGDVLSTDNDMEEWRLTEWTKEEEDQMTNEAFEWLRVDSDFEWICMIYINQPDYMYASQLQQDRDVVAQYECIRYFADAKPSPIYSTILVRTLMDRRYYYGIRTEAALTLAKYAIPDLDWIGRYHLLKAFQVMFCFPESLIPQTNDFSDFSTYFLQKAIPLALSDVKDGTGQTPLPIKEFLLDLLRYNENSNNTFSDCYYLGTLMTAISNAISKPPEQTPQFNFDFTFDVNGKGANGVNDKSAEAKFVEKAIVEIERCQRIDQWMPSYQNVVSTIAISIKEKLSQLGTINPSVTDVLHYTHAGLFDTLRLTAFSAILSIPNLYTAPESKRTLRYVFKTILTDHSYHVRLCLIKLLGRSLGKISMHKYGGSGKLGGGVGTFLIVEESGIEIAESRKDEYRRSNVEGCIDIVKEQFSEVDILKTGFWELLTSPALGVLEKRMVLDICGIIYDVRPTRLVKLRIPDQTEIIAKNLGHGKIKIYRADKPRPLARLAPIIDLPRSSGAGIDMESMTVTLPLPQNRIKLNIKIK